MDIFISVFEAVLLIFGLGMTGFIVLSRKIMPADVLKVLTPLIIDIALPCLVFTNLLKGSGVVHINDWWHLPLWWAAFTIFLLMAGFCVFFILNKIGKNGRKVYSKEVFMSLIYPNAIFFPLAIIPSITSDSSSLMSNHLIFTILFPAYVFNSWYLFKKASPLKDEKFIKMDLKKLFNPVFMATILALGLRLTSFDSNIPKVVLKLSGQIGNLTLPLIMMMIGGNIYIDYKNSVSFKFLRNSLFVLMKNIVWPALSLVFIYLAKPPLDIGFLLFLYSAVPTITVVPVLGERAGLDKSVLNQFLVSGFAFSIISIPVCFYLFSKIYNLSSIFG